MRKARSDKGKPKATTRPTKKATRPTKKPGKGAVDAKRLEKMPWDKKKNPLVGREIELAALAGGSAVDVRIDKPTREQFAAYRVAFRHFNKALFSGLLPEVLLNFSRQANSKGFFSPGRWIGPDNRTAHEISLNPDLLLDRTPRESASTLVHEMVHLWQEVHGKPPRKGYHDKEWSAKMLAIGLTPTSTGAAGGKMTGPKVTHLINPGGPFDLAFDTLSDPQLLPWRSSAYQRNGRPCGAQGGHGEGEGNGEQDGVDHGEGEGNGEEVPPKKRADPSKVKYSCPGCRANVWGKGGLLLDCRKCGVPFAEV